MQRPRTTADNLPLPLPAGEGRGEGAFSSPVADGGGGPRERDGGGASRPFHASIIASKVTKQTANSLRNEMSPPEVVLWQHLRRRQLDGLHFRRQHPLGPYIADFYCAACSLVIEVDGSAHQGQRKDRDKVRDQWMIDRRLRVLRVRALDVLENLEGVLAKIRREAQRSTKKTPSAS